jgi:hypothetical protein
MSPTVRQSSGRSFVSHAARISTPSAPPTSRHAASSAPDGSSPCPGAACPLGPPAGYMSCPGARAGCSQALRPPASSWPTVVGACSVVADAVAATVHSCAVWDRRRALPLPLPAGPSSRARVLPLVCRDAATGTGEQRQRAPAAPGGTRGVFAVETAARAAAVSRAVARRASVRARRRSRSARSSARMLAAIRSGARRWTRARSRHRASSATRDHLSFLAITAERAVSHPSSSAAIRSACVPSAAVRRNAASGSSRTVAPGAPVASSAGPAPSAGASRPQTRPPASTRSRCRRGPAGCPPRRRRANTSTAPANTI